MKKIMIMRHADAVPANIGAGDKDIDRPLSAKGKKDMAIMAKELVEKQLVPDLVYVSPAVRAQETLKHVLPDLPEDKIITNDRIYEASASELYDMIRLQDEDPETVMIIGHNPNIHGFAMFLADPQPSNFDFADFSKGFIAGALAILEFEDDFWINMMPAQNKLVSYLRPEVPEIAYRKV